jgi:hypothetical protein
MSFLQDELSDRMHTLHTCADDEPYSPSDDAHINTVDIVSHTPLQERRDRLASVDTNNSAGGNEPLIIDGDGDSMSDESGYHEKSSLDDEDVPSETFKRRSSDSRPLRVKSKVAVGVAAASTPAESLTDGDLVIVYL